MKRLILLSVVLLLASQWIRGRADDGQLPRPPKAKQSAKVLVTIKTADGSVCVTEGPSRATLVQRASALDVEHEAIDEEEDASADIFPESHGAVVPPASTRGTAYVISDLMSTPERAEQDAYVKLNQTITGWLVPEVRPDWKAPERLVRRLVMGPPALREIDRGYAKVEQAALKVDLSSERRAAFIKAYHKEEGAKRIGLLGGILAFVLACLATLVGYVRTDEATKGYYTNRLRLLAAGAVGAAGFGLYRFLA